MSDSSRVKKITKKSLNSMSSSGNILGKKIQLIRSSLMTDKDFDRYISIISEIPFFVAIQALLYGFATHTTSYEDNLHKRYIYYIIYRLLHDEQVVRRVLISLSKNKLTSPTYIKILNEFNRQYSPGSDLQPNISIMMDIINKLLYVSVPKTHRQILIALVAKLENASTVHYIFKTGKGDINVDKLFEYLDILRADPIQSNIDSLTIIVVTSILKLYFIKSNKFLIEIIGYNNKILNNLPKLRNLGKS